MSPTGPGGIQAPVHQEQLRNLPAIHQLVEHVELTEAVQDFGRDAVVSACRFAIKRARTVILSGEGSAPPEALVAEARRFLQQRQTLYRRALNATGVILHTNLGRAPIPEAAWEAMRQAADYCDLEMDLDSGKRASRQRGIVDPIAQLTGAEAGLIVNNNAAAVLLATAALAGSRPTAISRGHLVEIGGSFRLSTILEASGSPVMEVGSTNRTHLADYAEALDKGAGLILLVHKSNFTMSGFVTEPRPEEVIALAHERSVPVVLDLGSGNFTETTDYGLPEESTVPQAIAQGFDAVCFSGDKLMGGPQAGLIAGGAATCQQLSRHPLARALRCDKVQLAGVVATINLYLRQESLRQVPIWSMIHASPEALKERAEAWQQSVGQGEVVEAEGAVGGGSLPDASLSGYALRLSPPSPQALQRQLRQASPPVVGHIVNDHVLLHPRTVHPRDDAALVDVLQKALHATSAS